MLLDKLIFLASRLCLLGEQDKSVEIFTSICSMFFRATLFLHLLLKSPAEVIVFMCFHQCLRSRIL